MQTHGARRRGTLLTLILTLLLTLAGLAPGPALAQGIKDDQDEPATEEATEEPREPDEEPMNPAEREEEWEEAGLVGDASYESPQFGYTLDWSGDWELDLYYDQPDEDLQPVISDEEIEQDIIYLLWTDAGAEAYAVVSGQTVNRGSPEGDVEEWTDPDWIEESWESNLDVEALLDDTTSDAAAVLYQLEDTEDPDAPLFYTIYQSIVLDDGTTLYLTLSMPEDVAEDVYEAWAGDVEIEGGPIDLVFDWEDIEAAI